MGWVSEISNKGNSLVVDQYEIEYICEVLKNLDLLDSITSQGIRNFLEPYGKTITKLNSINLSVSKLYL